VSDLDRIEDGLMAFLDAYRRSRSRLYRDPGLKDLTMAQFSVLAAVLSDGQDGVGRIAAVAGLAQPPTTRAIRRLEDKGLVRRRPAAGDGRRIAVEVTTEGKRLLAHHRRRFRRAAKAIHDGMPEDQRERAAEILEILAAAIDKAP
jgi:DNA-binding MarR family transcriptional regulator